MSVAFDDYVAKRAAMDGAEADAAAAVGRIISAGQTLGTQGFASWKNLPLPGMPPPTESRTPPNRGLPARDKLEAWPTLEEVTTKILAYHRTVADVVAAYDALIPAERAAVRPPPPPA